jgi:cytochrome c oxidase subunit 2
VRLTFISDDVAHGIAVDALGISTVFSKANPAVIVVTPTVAGTFEGVCSRYCGAGHNRMRLIIHVIASQ